MKKILFLITVISVLSLQSCLKGRDMVLDPDAVPSVVEFGNPAVLTNAPSDSFRLYTVSYDIVPSATLEVPVVYTGANVASKDIMVNVEVDSEWLARYNTVKGTSISILPSSVYSFPGSTTIKSGSKTANISVTLKIDQISLSGAFILPLKITNASGETLSKYFSKILIRVTPKNAYDGLYSYKTSATTSLVPNANKTNVPLETVSATRVKTNLLYTYSNIIHYEIDPITNKVTVVDVFSSAGAPNSIGTCITDPSSHWDPVAKVLYAKWTAGTRSFEEWYTYTGSR